MVARRYEFYVLVARTISHSFAALTREILGSFRLDYEYEIEYEYDFSILVFRLHIITALETSLV